MCYLGGFILETERIAMSLQTPNPQGGTFWGPALAGACLAVVLSVPAAAFLASLLGGTYTVRCTVYGVLLLWTVLGAVLIFRRTCRFETRMPTPGKVLLWFLSVWLWPLLLFWGKKRDS